MPPKHSIKMVNFSNKVSWQIRDPELQDCWPENHKHPRSLLWSLKIICFQNNKIYLFWEGGKNIFKKEGTIFQIQFLNSHRDMAETKATSFKRKQKLKQKPWPSCPGAQQVHSPKRTLGGGEAGDGTVSLLLVRQSERQRGQISARETQQAFQILFKGPLSGSPSHSPVFILSPRISHLTNHFSLTRQRARKHSYSKISPIPSRSPAQTTLRLSITVGYLR